MGLFGRSTPRGPKEMVTEWNQKLRKECYQLDRQIRSIQREEEKIKRSLKEAAKKQDKDSCVVLAKEIIHARKAITKIHTSKAHINSVMLQMKNQLATLKIAGSLSKSTEVMQAMQALIRVPEIAQTMQNLSKEMMKAGIIEEMMDETMDEMELMADGEDMEESAQHEIDKLIWDITQGALGQAPAPPTEETLPAITPSTVRESPEEENDEIEEMQSRLAALKS